MLKIIVAVRYDAHAPSNEELEAKTADLEYTSFPQDKDGSRSYCFGGEVALEDLRTLIGTLVQRRYELG